MITSHHNQRLKNIRRIRRCKGSELLLEGPHLLRAALEADLPLETILVTPEFLTHSMDRSLLQNLPFPPTEVRASLLEELADTDSPRGILAVARLERGDAPTLPHQDGGLYIYADGVQDPGNLGALARVAEAAGVTGLALSRKSIHPNHPRALRASSGSLLRLPVAVNVTPEALDAHLAEDQPRWVALTPQQGTNLYQATLEGTLILAVGGEGPGLSSDLAERAQLRLTIPMASPVDSLNVTVAIALVVFEIRRRRRQLGETGLAPSTFEVAESLAASQSVKPS